MSSEPIDILSLTSAQFIAAAKDRGIGSGRALEVYREVFRTGRLRGGCEGWVGMPDMPVAKTQHEGETIKFTQCVGSGLETESVILPQKSRVGRDRNTLCISSQIGCAMGCTFCETAQMGLMKNLTAAQIIAQWMGARHHFGQSISNIVFMGMGEPMDNLDAVIQAIRVLAEHFGPSIAPSKITVSTVGRAEGIRRYAAFAGEAGFRQLGLAVSINAPNDAIRSQIMPINRATNMRELHEAMCAWGTSPTKRILIEYVLIPGVNDELAHADELCAYLKPLHCTVNVIPYNPRRDSPWPAPSHESVEQFIDRISANGQFVTRRRTMGRTLMAACGQLGSPTIRGRRVIAHAPL